MPDCHILQKQEHYLLHTRTRAELPRDLDDESGNRVIDQAKDKSSISAGVTGDRRPPQMPGKLLREPLARATSRLDFWHRV